jgi:hypothetical protein
VELTALVFGWATFVECPPVSLDVSRAETPNTPLPCCFFLSFSHTVSCCVSNDNVSGVLVLCFSGFVRTCRLLQQIWQTHGVMSTLLSSLRLFLALHILPLSLLPRPLLSLCAPRHHFHARGGR